MRFTKEDRNAGRILDAGWKVVEVKAITEEESKTGKDGHVADLIVTSPPRYEGCLLKDFYFDNMGRGKMMRMLGAAMKTDLELGKDYNLEAVVGEKLKIYTQPGTNPTNGQPLNQVMDYTEVDDTKAKVME